MPREWRVAYLSADESIVWAAAPNYMHSNSENYFSFLKALERMNTSISLTLVAFIVN